MVDTISNITGAETSAINKINNNFEELETAIDGRVSTSGDTMDGDLDMNNNDILNVKEIRATKVYIAGSQVTNDTSTVVAVPVDWQGAWSTSTNYVLNDGVSNDGSS